MKHARVLIKNALIMISITAVLALIAKQFGLDVDIVDVALLSGGGIAVDIYHYLRNSKGTSYSDDNAVDD